VTSPQRPPSVDALTRTLEAGGRGIPRSMLVAIARAAIEQARASGDGSAAGELAAEQVERVATGRPQRVVNATGVLLHTNLGRAPLHPDAAAAAALTAQGYGNVELDLTTGERGARHGYLGELMTALTGAEAGIAVNNNAGALLLALAAIVAPRGVVVSRGELIEIGGSFRLPELMAASGASMIEVGTTNRTRTADYRARLGDAAALLKVHPSNYRVEGFAEEVDHAALARLAAGAGIPLIADVGSGLLDVRTPWLDGPPPTWLSGEPGVRQTLQAGADLVLFSGDKLLGGPQAGIAVGRSGLVTRMARHPMMRALRLDGPTLAALTVTLELYGAGRASEIPFWQMARRTRDELERRLAAIADRIGGTVGPGTSLPGAGSVPGSGIPTPVLVLDAEADTCWRRLLDADPPILARRHEGSLVLDLRTVDPADDAHVAAALEDAPGMVD
jgi:L-seryl-tRNA(Ser) seleniumtransferase